jgi:hypothetical protein
MSLQNAAVKYLFGQKMLDTHFEMRTTSFRKKNSKISKYARVDVVVAVKGI